MPNDAGGVIYVIADNGDLMWYRHDGWYDGSFRWAFNEGKKVGRNSCPEAGSLRRNSDLWTPT